MKLEEAIEVISATRLFAGIDHETLRRVSERAIDRSFRRRERLFHQGDSGESLFVMVDGAVKVFVTSEDGKEMVLATLRPGDTFGELALVDGGPRSASAEALEPTVVLILTRGVFLELLRAHPSLVEAFHRSLGALLRRLLEQASDLAFLDLPGRVAKLLVTLAEEQGGRADGALYVDLNVTQGDLARMVGGSRPSVNQILRSFEARGYLEMQGNRVLVRRPEVLKRRAGL